MMLLREDVEDDLTEAYAEYYNKEGQLLVYQNGKDNARYMVEIKVFLLDKED
jgi:hypothetical protein